MLKRFPALDILDLQKTVKLTCIYAPNTYFISLVHMRSKYTGSLYGRCSPVYSATSKERSPIYSGRTTPALLPGSSGSKFSIFRSDGGCRWGQGKFSMLHGELDLCRRGLSKLTPSDIEHCRSTIVGAGKEMKRRPQH